MKRLLEIESKLSDLDVAQEKLRTVCSDLISDYFDEEKPKDRFLQSYYNASAIKAHILLDYSSEIKGLIKDLTELLDVEFQERKKAS